MCDCFTQQRLQTSALAPPQELLAELQAMDEAALVDWAAANRGALTLDLLQLVAQTQSAAVEEEERQRLWALGSKLMAVREGLGEAAGRAGRCSAGGSALVCLPASVCALMARWWCRAA